MAPGGEFIARVGRAGSGPGEFLAPADLCILSSGAVAVSDPRGRLLSIFRPDYSFDRVVDGFYPNSAICHAAGTGRGDSRISEDHTTQRQPVRIHSREVGGGTRTGRRIPSRRPKTSTRKTSLHRYSRMTLSLQSQATAPYTPPSAQRTRGRFSASRRTGKRSSLWRAPSPR